MIIKKGKVMRKALFFVLISASIVSFSFGQQKKFQVYLFGGLNHVLEYGSKEGYVLGENDFPVTPAHTPASLGAAVAVFFTNNIGVELDGRYTLSSKLTLQDPSDQDAVEIDSAKHYTITLNLVYQLLSGKFRPYVVAGGGMDKLLAEEETYTSEYGYEIEFLAPEETIDPVANLGAGIQYFINENLKGRLDFRYVLIFDDLENVNNLNIVAGVCFSF